MERSSTAKIAVIVAAAVIAVCSLLSVGELRYRTCIAQAEAKYPAVPVSAFSGRTTGPIKVSYVEARAEAVDDCGRL